MSFSCVHLPAFQFFDESELFLPFELPLKGFVRKEADESDEPDENDSGIQPVCDTVGKSMVLLRPSGEEEPDDEPV